MPLTREDVRASVERAGDQHWRALIAHHEEAYPDPRPTPGDVCRAEAERLNQAGYGDSERWTLLESRVERVSPTEVSITHVFRSTTDGSTVTLPPLVNYS